MARTCFLGTYLFNFHQLKKQEVTVVEGFPRMRVILWYVVQMDRTPHYNDAL